MPGWAGGGVSCGPGAPASQASAMFLDGWKALLAGGCSVWGEADFPLSFQVLVGECGTHNLASTWR